MQNVVVNLRGIEAIVLPGRGSLDPKSQKYYEAAYETWKIVWKQTLLELDGTENLFSDPFTRQDYMLTLFHGPICIAICCFRRVDLSKGIDRDDSWFRPWEQVDLQQFGKKSKNGVVVSWLTVHPDYRRTMSIGHLKEFDTGMRLCELINFFLQDCKAELAFGVTRNNRSVDKMSEYVGFRAHAKGASFHGVNVNLIVISQVDLIGAETRYPQAAYDLWNSRRVFIDAPLEISLPPSITSKGLSQKAS